MNYVTGDCGTPKCASGICVADGNIDNGDLPIDNNECTDDVCTNGVPSNPSAAEGTACNNNTEVCNGAAMTPLCVECTPNFDANGPKLNLRRSVLFELDSSTRGIRL